MRILTKQSAAISFAVLSVAVLTYSYFSVLIDVYRKCKTNDDYSHGLLLPFVSVGLLWIKREELFSKIREIYALNKGQLRFSSVGLFFLLCGIAIDFFATVSGQLSYFRWVAFFVSGTGIILLTFGFKVGVLFLPAFLLLFMARPIPESLTPLLFNPLQVFAAHIGAWVLEVLGVPVYLLGNVIEVPGVKLLVEEACSGMRSVMSLLTVACIVTYLLDLRLIGFLALSVCSVVVAIALNVVRVSLTGVIAYFVNPELATGFFHEFTGLVVFVVGLAILYGLARWAEILTYGKSSKKES